MAQERVWGGEGCGRNGIPIMCLYFGYDYPYVLT